MKLQWLGHSSFRLIESTGASIITDPFEAQTVGYSMAYLPCDAVTSCFDSDEHNNFKAVKGNPVIINSVGAHDINGIGITGFIQNNENKEKKNLIFKYRLDGVTVCHLGAITKACSSIIIEKIIPVNVLLIPVGGDEFSLTAKKAKEYVDNIMPDIVIPMRFKTKDTALNLDKVDSFLRLFDSANIFSADNSTVEFNRFDFDGSTTKVLVPKRFKG